MAVNKRWIISASLIVILAAVLLLWHAHQPKPKPGASHQAVAQQRMGAPAKPLSAGGQPVPPSLQQKARAKGYYCPSWNAQPGQAAPDVCYSLDR